MPELLRQDPNFRTMLLSRLLLAGAMLSIPFYTVLAVTEFALAPAVVGTFVVVRQVFGMLGNLWWARVSQRAGNRAVIRGAAVGQLAAPVYALVLLALATPLKGALPAWGLVGVFLPIYAVLGATIFAEVIGYTSFVITIAPEDRRPTYIGLMNTTMGVAGLFPAIGGVLGDLFGFRVVFLVTLVMVAAGLVLAGKLQDPLAESKTPET